MKQKQEKNPHIKTIAKITILSALATVIMALKIPLWFAPSFYKFDLSEVAVLIGAFAMGPLAGVVIELLKVLMNLFVDGTITGGIGELANFLMGCSFILPASILYRYKKTMSSAMIGLIAGVVVLTLTSALMNYYILLPMYAKVFGMPMESLIGMGTAINASITDIRSFILIAVVPFNVIKGVLNSVVTFFLYKRVSPILHK